MPRIWHQKLTDHQCDRRLPLAISSVILQSPWVSRLSLSLRRPLLLAHHVSVPGSREATTVHHVGGEDALLTWPLLAWQFIGDLQAVAVRIAEIDAERHSVISDAVDHDVLLLEPEISFLEVVEALHHESEMIEADLPLLLQWRIVADLHQRHLVRLVRVCGHEGGE